VLFRSPFLVWHLRPRGVVVLAVGVAITALLTRAFMISHGWPQATVYEFTICRIDALAFGAAAAAALRERRLAVLFDRPGRLVWAALGVGLTGMLVSHAYQPYGPGAQTVGYLMLSIAFALWILGLACQELPATPQNPPLRGHGWLRWAWLRRCGRYSYAMYLLHVPLAVAAGRPLLAALRPDQAGRSALQPGAVSALYVTGMMALTYGLAWCSYHGLERHFLARKPRYAETGEALIPARALA
jgi:peptidoglycan/LPS O-acetylase OafA/YrhL